MPVQKLTNPVEQIRDKESCVASRRCEFFARYEEITSYSTSDGASGDVGACFLATLTAASGVAYRERAIYLALELD
jgi:hypothetical protein